MCSSPHNVYDEVLVVFNEPGAAIVLPNLLDNHNYLAPSTIPDQPSLLGCTTIHNCLDVIFSQNKYPLRDCLESGM